MSTNHACLDAETLAAWMDGGLDAASVAAAESHVSTCARCQSLVATFARTEPLAPGTQAPGTLALWWMAPLAATAAAAVLWMVVPQEPVSPLAPAAPSPSITAERNAAPPPGAVKPEAAQRSTPPAPATELKRSAPQAEPPQTFADAARVKELGAAAGNRERLEKKEAEGQRADAAAAPALPAPAETAAALQRMTKAASVEIVSSDPARRWRAAGGTIEHSPDGGRTWAPVHTGGESIVAGSSPLPTVCWLVGRSGTVLLTTDGVTFARVSPPANVDLVAVTATNDRAAAVTAADGRVFSTTDSGQTWRSQ